MPLPAFAGVQLLAFAPLLPLLVFGAGLVGWQRRNWSALALLPFVGVLGFVYLLFVSGSSFSHLRPFLPAIPLALGCVAVITADPNRGTPRARTRSATIGIALIAALLVVPAFATTALAMNDHKLGADERLFLGWVISGRTENADQRAKKALIPSARHISDAIDALHLPDGSIVTDTFTSCVSMVLMMSDHPHQYVITSDRDYERVLADPPTFHAHYLLVPPPKQYGSLDAVNRAYPRLYENGSGFARKVKEFNEPGCPTFRLYRTERSPRDVGGTH